MNILFVENHARFARLARTRFLSAHQVTTVPSLRQAREALRTMSFDVVLLDYDLDDGKGTELFQELNQLPKQPLIVATSSHQTGNDALLKSGADAICSKMQFQEIELILNRLNSKS